LNVTNCAKQRFEVRPGMVCRVLWLVAAAWFGCSEIQGALPPPSKADDTITIYEMSGKTQTNRPVSVPRAFRKGEFRDFISASIGATPLLTQTDVKNRWPDGSVKFAVVSFVIPRLPAHKSVTVSFTNQAGGNNSGYLSGTDMLDLTYDFDVRIEMSGASGRAETVSARQILQSGAVRYWLQGPVVTAVIIEDRTPARSYDKDFGDGSKALHPIFEAWFYPADKHVEIGATIENTWASSAAAKSARDLSYSVTITAGLRAKTAVFRQPTFNHIGFSRWHKRLRLGGDANSLRVDHNISYLVSTHAIPNYDPGLHLSKSLISANAEAWKAANKTIAGTADGLGNYARALSSGGSHPWIGLANTWDILYLLSMDDRLLQMSLGNADLAGRFPWHMREADTHAGSGHFFDEPENGKVDTFGRVLSINARRTVASSELASDPAECGGHTEDKIRTGVVTDDGMGFYNRARHHIPDVAYVPYLLTGRYYYLEGLQFEAAYILSYKQGCYGENWERHGEDGYFNDSETRGDAWSYRTTAYAAFLSPDETPEKAYFENKLLNNIAKDEGRHNLKCDVPGREKHCEWGRKNQLPAIGASPLGIWDEGNPGLVEAPVKTDGSVSAATSPWMENFVLAALGVARDFGYPTDALLRFQAKRLFNQLLNPKTSPYLVEAYRTATILSATKGWIQNWADANRYHHVPASWRLGQDVDNGYGFIALGALSFLYPYSADGYTGAQAWLYLKSSLPEQDRFESESPKFDILPRPIEEAVRQVRSTEEPTGTSKSIGAVVQGKNCLECRKFDNRPRLTVAAQAETGRIPSTVGWFRIPSSQLQSVCPTDPAVHAIVGCAAVVEAWSGGIADTRRNQLIIWGGGHGDYYGNEIYALDLNALAMKRLNNPGPVDNVPSCPEAYVDGTPSSRHTYGALAYLGHVDRMFVFGGGKTCGNLSAGTWTLDLETLRWQLMNPGGTIPQAGPGQVADYDPNTKSVFLHDYVSGLYTYRYETNTWKKILDDPYGIDYHMSGVVDPKRKLFFVMGGGKARNGGVQVFHLKSGSRQSWSVGGCADLINSESPGLAYDPVLDRIVGWPNFGNSVYLFNPDTRSCTTQTFDGGPPDSHQDGRASSTRGTFGRFRFFPALDVFAVVNDSDIDAYLLRLTPAPKNNLNATADLAH
jgi:hypothetical protein